MLTGAKLHCFVFSQNFVIDIGFFTGGKKEKGKDERSEKKQPPMSKQKYFNNHGIRPSMDYSPNGAMFCTWCVEKKICPIPRQHSSQEAVLIFD